MKIHAFNDTYLPPVDKRIYGKTIKWWPSDKENTYDPVDNEYGPNDISYTFNNHGFRSDNFDIISEKRIVFLGCSMTAGIGLPLEHTWPYFVLQYIKRDLGIDIPFWSLTVPGGGLDILVRMYYHYGIKLKPQLVFGYFPGYRRELYYGSNNKPSLFLPNITDLNFDNIPYLADPRIIQYETEKNMCFLDSMLKINNTKMIWNTWDLSINHICDNLYYKHNFMIFGDKKARDKQHAGREAQMNFAKKVYMLYVDEIAEILKD